MKVDIIMCTYQMSDMTEECLTSLARCTQDVDYRLIWVDNGSDDKHICRTVEVLRMEGIPHIAKFNATNEGFVKGTNAGLALSTAPYVALLNNDVILTPQWLSQLIKGAEKFPKVGLVGPTTSPPSSGELKRVSWQSVTRLAERGPVLEGFAPVPKYPGDDHAAEYAALMAKTYEGKYQNWCGMVAFFCVLIKRAVLDDIGFLSEDYGMGFGDDDDYCLRAEKAGWGRMLAWDTFVVHKHRSTWKKHIPDWEKLRDANWAKFKANNVGIEKPKLRILVAQQHLYRLGGSEQATYTLIQELVRRGHDVKWYSPMVQEGHLSGLSRMADEIMALAPLVNNLKGVYDRIFVSHRPIAEQVIHNKRHGLLTGLTVQTCHGIYPDLEQPALGMDYYVAISDEVRKHVRQRGVVATVITNGINCSRYKSTSPINKELKTVLSLVQAGPAVPLVKRVCEKLGLEYLYITKNNRQDPTWDVERYMNMADLVVSLGRGAYEAMACRRAVVVLDSRGYMGTRCMADGIVTEDNWQHLLLYNFSGRRYQMAYDDEALIAEFGKYEQAMGVVNRQIALEAFNIRVQVGKYLALGDGK